MHATECLPESSGTAEKGLPRAFNSSFFLCEAIVTCSNLRGERKEFMEMDQKHYLCDMK